ncbi:hypothetical protein O181_005496 [Austropuccinia psidii MF-1]|uniref:Copia protein n=1 Tax=Austropuccinia psidii MF-1 TaxID=1389203 RepID=A0A9Q3BHC8_9BASI|nr:hypothetical protein [Austropuccinia psidii MF-1]
MQIGETAGSRRSTTGYLIKINDSLIIWKTCKQSTVSLSSAEAEYKSLTDLTSEILWLRQFCKEIKIAKVKEAIIVHEDKQGCIDTANSDCNTNTKWMKHINIQLHFICEIIANSIIKLKYTPTTDMLADFLTKSTTHPAINQAMKELRLLRMGDKGCVKDCALSQSMSKLERIES